MREVKRQRKKRAGEREGGRQRGGVSGRGKEQLILLILFPGQVMEHDGEFLFFCILLRL